MDLPQHRAGDYLSARLPRDVTERAVKATSSGRGNIPSRRLIFAATDALAQGGSEAV